MRKLEFETVVEELPFKDYAFKIYHVKGARGIERHIAIVHIITSPYVDCSLYPPGLLFYDPQFNPSISVVRDVYEDLVKIKELIKKFYNELRSSGIDVRLARGIIDRYLELSVTIGIADTYLYYILGKNVNVKLRNSGTYYNLDLGVLLRMIRKPSVVVYVRNIIKSIYMPGSIPYPLSYILNR